jgi:hypothetical protein
VVVGIIVVVMVAAAVFVGINFTKPSSGPQFSVVAKEYPSPESDGTVVWNFTLTYNGEKTLQDVNFFLNNDQKPFMRVPQLNETWTDFYLWTSSNNTAARITISWENGEEQYAFQP